MGLLTPRYITARVCAATEENYARAFLQPLVDREYARAYYVANGADLIFRRSSTSSNFDLAAVVKSNITADDMRDAAMKLYLLSMGARVTYWPEEYRGVLLALKKSDISAAVVLARGVLFMVPSHCVFELFRS
jgi:hypothetical protein